MKKFFTFLTLIFISIFIFCDNVAAFNLELSTTTPTINEKVDTTVKINISNLHSSVGIKKIIGIMTFDTNYLSFVSGSGVTGVTKTTITDDGVGRKKIIIEALDGTNISADSLIANIVFKGITQVASTNISFRVDYQGTNALNLVDSQENAPSSFYPGAIVNSNNLAIAINKVKSENNNLKSLTIKDASNTVITYTPTFNSNTLLYAASCAYNVENIVVTVETEDTSAKVVGTGSLKITKESKNTFPITVTSETGVNKVYTLEITALPEVKVNNANLLELSIKQLENFKFITTKTVYTLNIDKKIKILELEYKTVDTAATVEVINNKDLKDGSRIEIIVTAADKQTTKTYVLKIKKDEEIATTIKIEKEIIKEKNPYIIGGLGTIALSLFGALIYVIKKEE